METINLSKKQFVIYMAVAFGLAWILEMIASIFSNIWDNLTKFSSDCYDFIMEHYSDPVFWIVIVAILILICFTAISNIANK